MTPLVGKHTHFEGCSTQFILIFACAIRLNSCINNIFSLICYSFIYFIECISVPVILEIILYAYIYLNNSHPYRLKKYSSYFRHKSFIIYMENLQI